MKRHYHEEPERLEQPVLANGREPDGPARHPLSAAAPSGPAPTARAAWLVLLAANLVYATSYAATRVVLEDVPPATLALARLLLGGAVLVPFARRLPLGVPLDRGEALQVRLMGLLGFGAAFALGNWGLERSTATNAALLITLEPTSLMLLGPLLLGERLTRHEAIGGALTVAGALLVVSDGLPGLGGGLFPHWRGDALLVLSALAYASYSLLGRRVLVRHGAAPVTLRSLLWGIPLLVPLAAAEWLGGQRPAWTLPAVAGTLYLSVVITALGYLAWNWALERVPASRAAAFLNVQPVAGALLGVLLLGEPLSAFTLLGGALVVVGLVAATWPAAPPPVYSQGG